MTIQYDPRAQAKREIAALRKLARLHNESHGDGLSWTPFWAMVAIVFLATGFVGAFI